MPPATNGVRHPAIPWRDTTADPANKLKAIEAALNALAIALGHAGFSRADAITIDMAARAAITMCAQTPNRKTNGNG